MNTTTQPHKIAGEPADELGPETAADVTPDTEMVSLRAENERLKTTIRNAAAHRQITGELGRIGARSPELLFEFVKGDLQFADNDAVINAAALIERMRRSFPEQFVVERPTAIDAAAGQAIPPRLSKEALGRMTAAEIAELDWNDVKRVLSAS